MFAPKLGAGLNACVSQENIPVLVPFLGAFRGPGDCLQYRFLGCCLLQNIFKCVAIVGMLADHRVNKVFDFRITDIDRLYRRASEENQQEKYEPEFHGKI